MHDSPAPVRFGHLIRAFRNERGFSQLELAGRADISCRHLSFLETGRARPSEAMVSRLGQAMETDCGAIDDLRVAAGFCARHPLPRPPSVGDRVVGSALLMDRAANVAQIIDAGRPVLQTLGIAQFFVGTLSQDATGKPAFDWLNVGALPEAWLHRYDRERYAATDPLLAAVQKTAGCFFWEDVIDR